MRELGTALIAAERTKQVFKHGRDAFSDARNNPDYQLAKAAGKLVQHNPLNGWAPESAPVNWDRDIWRKLTQKTYKQRLIVAGALIAAELDRIIYLEEAGLL